MSLARETAGKVTDACSTSNTGSSDSKNRKAMIAKKLGPELASELSRLDEELTLLRQLVESARCRQDLPNERAALFQ